MHTQFHALRDGSTIPTIGIGTFGSDRYTALDVASGVSQALQHGYRLVDCAAVYGNESEIGHVLSDALGGALKRDELFVMSKVWNDHHKPDHVRASVERSLESLGLEHLDACFIHWPFPNSHPTHADSNARDPHAKPYIHESFMRTWQSLESLVDEGLVRQPGLSNITVPKLKYILRDCRIMPSLAEIEHHPTFQQGELFQHLTDHQIRIVGYSPLGSPSRPARDRAVGDLHDMSAPTVERVARTHEASPAQICIAWAIARGVIPIPFSVKGPQIKELYEATQIHLSIDDLNILRSADRNNRLVKGQVFLWPGADSWLDLWDIDGTIPGWRGYGS